MKLHVLLKKGEKHKKMLFSQRGAICNEPKFPFNTFEVLFPFPISSKFLSAFVNYLKEEKIKISGETVER